MVVAAAAVNGVFFQPPPAGRGLAGVIDARFCTGDGLDVLPRERGDSREAAEQIQYEALARQKVASGSGDRGDDRSGGNGSAVLSQQMAPGFDFHLIEYNADSRQAGDDARFSGDDVGGGGYFFRNERNRRPILAAVELFENREADNAAKVLLNLARPGELGEIVVHSEGWVGRTASTISNFRFQISNLKYEIEI